MGGQWEVIEGNRGGEAQDNLAVHHETDAHNEARELGRYNEDNTEGQKPASKRNQGRWLKAITEVKDPSRR